jgi:methylphosphotriester-DNA--protein-cysteine methyltransferase
MPKLRQSVSVLAWDYPSGWKVPVHSHVEDQLVYAQRGVMTLTTPGATWVVPPQRAVWVPRNVAHAIAMSGRVEMRTLYLRGRPLLASCTVLEVSPLLRELVIDIVVRKGLEAAPAIDRARRAVLAAELRASRCAGVRLPTIQDSRANGVLEKLRQNPGAGVDLRGSGLSLRTLQRVVLAETGLSLGRYSRQLRLLASLERLATGAKVTNVAVELGYDSPSAFIAAFKALLGTTPAQYFR